MGLIVKTIPGAEWGHHMSVQGDRDQAVVFGDVHANLAALEAVFADMAERNLGPDRYPLRAGRHDAGAHACSSAC